MQSKTQLIKEMIEDALLAESRAKDLKKKYPALAEFGVIDELSKIDPSGNNKYLGWMLKHWIAVMQEQFADKGFAAFMAADADQELSPEEETKLVNLEREITASTQRVLNALEPILRTYHQGLDLAKSLQKSGRINLDGPANDINTFEPGSLELLQFVRELKAEKQRREQEKEQAKAISKQAKQESNVIYEDENVKVIRPNTKLASCYFGKGTKWCISAEMSQNYFDSYTSQGKAFYFMFWSGAPNPNHPFAKVAMVVDTLSPVPEVEEYFDSPDNSIYSDEVIDGVASMWQESGYAGKTFAYEDESYVQDEIKNTIDAIEREAVEDAEQNRAGPNIERYEEILEEVNHREWKYLDIYLDDMGDGQIYIRASLNIDLNEVVKRYMNEKKFFLQWAPGFPDQYSEEWLEGTLFNWILEWYRVNQSADIWDILAEDTAPTDKDDLRLSFNIELEPEVYRDIDRFESLAADFERDDASLAQNISELIEDEEFFDVYKKDESRDEEEWPLILSKYDEEYFPGGPEFKKDQMELPFNDNGRRPGDVIDQMTKRNQRFSPIDLPDDLREQLEQKVLQKLESKLVAEAFINELPEISKKELLKLAQEADKSPESQQKLVELISRLLGDYFELGDPNDELEESIFLEALDKYSELSGLGTLLERGPAPNASNDAALAKELLISLPKFVPNESWGKSGSVAREEIRKFVNLLRGGTIQERMSHLMRIQQENNKINATNRIISSLILLESLRSIILSYNASSAGFVFEGFIAALMNGEQIDAKKGGALPIEDVMAFTYDGQKPGVPYSLKLLKSGADVHGSYKNLIYSLFDAYREQGMGYVVAYKSGDASASDFSISLREYHFNSSNIIDILYKEAHNHELLRYKNKKITQKMIDAMSPEEALELLMNSDGALRGKGKSGWKLSANALEQVEYKDLGTLQLSSSAIQKTAERYIQKLQENITTLFKSVSQLSDHINEYIVSKDRDKAMLNGREAIKDTQKIKKSLENQQKTDK